MKPTFAARCLISHSFWSNCVHEDILRASAWHDNGNESAYLNSVNDALDAAFRAGMWLDNWRREMAQWFFSPTPN